MAWIIKERTLVSGSLKSSSTNFHRLVLGFFFCGRIHDVSEPTRVTAILIGLLLELVNGALVNQIESDHDAATDGRLARIEVTDEHYRTWLLVHVDLDDVQLVNCDFDVLKALSFCLHDFASTVSLLLAARRRERFNGLLLLKLL